MSGAGRREELPAARGRVRARAGREARGALCDRHGRRGHTAVACVVSGNDAVGGIGSPEQSPAGFAFLMACMNPSVFGVGPPAPLFGGEQARACLGERGGAPRPPTGLESGGLLAALQAAGRCARGTGADPQLPRSRSAEPERLGATPARATPRLHLCLVDEVN